jgi:aspartate carbamoyltransferase catalytic subunit
MTAVLTEPAALRVAGTRHLLSSEDLDRPTIERLLGLAASFEAVAEREV